MSAINMMYDRVMMVLSYATIICQLNVLKIERRRITNLRGGADQPDGDHDQAADGDG